jgi:hypothetical protein
MHVQKYCRSRTTPPGTVQFEAGEKASFGARRRPGDQAEELRDTSQSFFRNNGCEDTVLLSHVFTAFVKCPPSIWAQRELNKRLTRSGADSACFAVTFLSDLPAAGLPVEGAETGCAMKVEGH